MSSGSCASARTRTSWFLWRRKAATDKTTRSADESRAAPAPLPRVRAAHAAGGRARLDSVHALGVDPERGHDILARRIEIATTAAAPRADRATTRLSTASELRRSVWMRKGMRSWIVRTCGTAWHPARCWQASATRPRRVARRFAGSGRARRPSGGPARLVGRNGVDVAPAVGAEAGRPRRVVTTGEARSAARAAGRHKRAQLGSCPPMGRIEPERVEGHMPARSSALDDRAAVHVERSLRRLLPGKRVAPRTSARDELLASIGLLEQPPQGPRDV